MVTRTLSGPFSLQACLVKGRSEEVVIVPFGTRELVSKFSGVWMLLESVV